MFIGDMMMMREWSEMEYFGLHTVKYIAYIKHWEAVIAQSV
jgi:hypothetical protein